MTAAFVLREREQLAVREALASLDRDVEVTLELGPSATPVTLLAAGGREIDTGAVTRNVVEAVCGLALQHSVTSSSGGPLAGRKRGPATVRLAGRKGGPATVRLTVVEHDEPGPWPRTTIGRGLVYHGMPVGYELTTLVHAIVEAGRATSSLALSSLERLAVLERDVAIDVFVTPT